MYKAYKVRLYPTTEQEELMWKSVNASRYIWNWGLAYQMERFSNGEKLLSGYDMRKELIKHKVENEWLKEVSSKVGSNVLLDLEIAYRRFFNVQKKGNKFTKETISKAKRTGKKLRPYDMNGHPKFKKKGKCRNSFYVTCDAMYFLEDFVVLPTLKKVKYKTNYELPVCKSKRFNTAKFTNPRVSNDNGKWILSFGMEFKPEKVELNDFAVGIDVGIKDLAIVSCNGEKTVYKNINKTKRVRKLEKRLKHAQRKVSRKYHTNGNYEKTNRVLKAEQTVNQLHSKLKNIRKDYTHKTTTEIVNMLPHTVVTEDLNVAGMRKNRHLAKAISDQCLSEFIRQIEYKCEHRGIKHIKADRWYPSSKTCSGCGSIKRDLKLKDRIYRCEHCGLEIDRDFNASLNLERLAYS